MTGEESELYQKITFTLICLLGGANCEAFLRPADDDARLVLFFALAAKSDIVLHKGGDFRKRPIVEWYDDTKVHNVIGRAVSGSREAHESLLAMMAAFGRDDLEVPPELARYSVRIAIDAPPKFKRGPRQRYLARDIAIWLIVATLRRMGVPPTRNPSLRGEDPPTSGCSLLRSALQGQLGLDISDDIIESVWNKRDQAFLSALWEGSDGEGRL